MKPAKRPKQGSRMSLQTHDAVIFDLDGTLIDTEALCNLTGVEACRALGHEVSLDFFETLAGIHDVERARLIGEHVGAEIPLEPFYAEWDRLCSLRFREGIPLKPSAIRLLEAVADRGLPMAVATSSRSGPAREKIGIAGIAGFFREVITIDDVAAPKPAPEPYLLAAERLSIAPRRCIAFEDSETGAASAHAAGLTVVQVPDIHAATGRFAHHVAASLLEGARLAGLLSASEAA
jgi:HAD superfamily hydrolase (TIGR01509 family)